MDDDERERERERESAGQSRGKLKKKKLLSWQALLFRIFRNAMPFSSASL